MDSAERMYLYTSAKVGFRDMEQHSLLNKVGEILSALKQQARSSSINSVWKFVWG